MDSIDDETIKDLMGKKPRKTKEFSVAIAEASSKGEEEEQQSQSLPQTPRKRGRPRKVVEKKELLGEEEEEAEDIEHGVADEDSKSQLKSFKTSKPEEQQSSERGEKIQIPNVKEEGSSASVGGERKEDRRDALKQPSRSRARRKSKPRKSS